MKEQHAKYVKNWVIPLVIRGISASSILRFSNGDFRKTDLSFPRYISLLLHHYLRVPATITVQEIAGQKLSSRNFLVNFKREDDNYLSQSCGFRSNLATQEVDDEKIMK